LGHSGSSQESGRITRFNRGSQPKSLPTSASLRLLIEEVHRTGVTISRSCGLGRGNPQCLLWRSVLILARRSCADGRGGRAMVASAPGEIGCSAKPDGSDPCAPIPGSNGSATNQVGISSVPCGPACCSGCDGLLSAEFCRCERAPCPHCGSTARTFGVGIETTAAVLPIFKLLGLRARMSRGKGWLRIFEGLVPQRSRGGVLARVERRLDRHPEPALYTETVTMQDQNEG